jgi:hypothetical protein
MDEKTRTANSAAAAAAPWEEDAKGFRKLPAIVGGLLLLVAGWLVFAGDDAEKTSVAAAPAETPPPPPPPSTTPPTTPPTPPPAAVISPAPTEPAPTPTAGTPPPEPKKTTSPRATPSETRPATSPTPAPSEPAPDPTARIEAALKEGWMREAAGVLVVFPSSTPVPWERAANVCRRSEAGLSGWKLASRTQLEALRKANVLPMGTWWSSTAGVDETRAFALTTTASAPEERSKADDRASPACVRARP